jgi:carboxyl-terminal processing protease
MRARVHHRLSIVIALAALAACSQGQAAPSPSASTSASTTTSAASVAEGSAAPASSTPATKDEEDDLTIPPEKFSDPEKAFETAMTAIKSKYYAAGLTDEDLYRAAVRGMVTDIDPTMHRWNKLLSPHEYQELTSDLAGQIVGIGVHIKFDAPTGHIAVVGTIAGSPAEKAGLRATDTILSVNGKLFKGKSMVDAVNEIRGRSGEAVTLSVLRDDKILPFTLTRANVSFDQVSHAIIDGVGYVSVQTFSARTTPAVKAALDDFAANHARALAVDLRENMGGSFDEAVHVAELFLPAGTPIVTLTRRDGKTETMTSKGSPDLPTVPVVVLVDHGTASSGELLAGALSEQRHARTVGVRTYGKWSVQNLEELGNGYAIKFTTALFQTPGGKSYEGAGFAPDVEVDEDDDKVERSLLLTNPGDRVAIDPQLKTALSLLAL